MRPNTTTPGCTMILIKTANNASDVWIPFGRKIVPSLGGQ